MNDWDPNIPLAVRSELPPFGIKPHWVTFTFSTPANRLYDLYNAHVNRDRADLVVWPTLDDLARMMGLSRGDKVSPYMRELETGGAIGVKTITKTGGNGRRYVVTLKVHPPADYAGPLQSSDWHRVNQAAKPVKQGMKDRARSTTADGPAGQEVPPPEGVYVSPVERGDVHPLQGGVTSNKSNQNNEQEQPAPSARSARGVRSTSPTGSSARGNSGSAAAGKAGSSTGEAGQTAVPGQRSADKTELTDEQLAAVRAVEAGLPRVLVAKLPYDQLPKRNRAAVLAALESRTPEQIAARIARRWVNKSYEAAFHHGEVRSYVGLALELIAPTPYCPDLSCEDRQIIDTGEDCKACEKRIADRTAARLAGKPVATGGSGKHTGSPECDVCQNPVPDTAPYTAPEDVLCRGCTASLARSRQHLLTPLAVHTAELEAYEEAEQREAEARQQEAARRREACTPQAPARQGVDPEQAAAQAEEDRRLQAEVLAANPWMAQHAAPETVAALQGSPAPF